MRIGIDFDRVLFRTDDFKEFLEQQIPGFLEDYPESQPVYDPAKHAEKLGVEKEEIMKALARADKFLYEDVTELEKLQPEHEVILVSRGNPSFQGKKITNSGICEIVDAVVILENGSKDRINIDFLVDDLETEHERTDIPGFHFDRRKHTIDDVVEKVREVEARKSV